MFVPKNYLCKQNIDFGLKSYIKERVLILLRNVKSNKLTFQNKSKPQPNIKRGALNIIIRKLNVILIKKFKYYLNVTTRNIR